MKLISSLLLCIWFTSFTLTLQKSASMLHKSSISHSKKAHKKREGEDGDDGVLKAPPQRKYNILAKDKLSGITNEYDADLSYSDAGIWIILYDSPKEIRAALMEAEDVIRVAEQAEEEEKLAKDLENIAFHLGRTQKNDEVPTDSAKLKEEFRKNSEEHQYLIPFRVVKNCEYKLLGSTEDRKSNTIFFNVVNENMNYNFIQGKAIGLHDLDIEIWVDDAWTDYSEIKEDNIQTLADSCVQNRDQLTAATKLYMEKYGIRKQTAEKEREINKKTKELEALWKMMGEKMKKYKQLFSSYGFAPAKIEQELSKVNELKDGEPSQSVSFTYLKQLEVHGNVIGDEENQGN